MTNYKLPDTKAFESNINTKNTHLLTLKNRTGMQVALTDYGARLVSALVPNKHGELVDVVLGFPSISGYQNAAEHYHGATIGRYAGRIAHGAFSINGTNYTLNHNNGHNSLHGGPTGFHNQVWDRQVSFNKQIDFYYVSPDGEEGFPGNLNVNVSYELTNQNEIKIRLRANTDKPTVINLTNHAYFNLNGEGNGDILNHQLQIPAQEFLLIDTHQIPTGQFLPVENTPFDFREPKSIIKGIHTEHSQLNYASGYDHSFINKITDNKPVATVYSEDSGILLEVFTDLPSIHLYTANFLSTDKGKSGRSYQKHGGFCLEAQHFPDSPNHKDFPSVLLQPDVQYDHTIIYKFGLKK